MTKIPVNIRENMFTENLTKGKQIGSEQSQDFTKIMDSQKKTQTDLGQKNRTQKNTNNTSKPRSADEENWEKDSELKEEGKKKEIDNPDASELVASLIEVREMFSAVQVDGIQEEVTDFNLNELKDFLGNLEVQSMNGEMTGLQQTLTETVTDFENQVMQALDLNSDEFQSLLSDLGMESVDVLDETNLRQLVLEASGASDATEFLTNEALLETNLALQENLKDVKNIISQQIVQSSTLTQPKGTEDGLRNAFEDMTETKNTKVIDGENIVNLNLDVQTNEGQDLFQNGATKDDKGHADSNSSEHSEGPGFASYTGTSQFAINQENMTVEQSTDHIPASYSDNQNVVMNQVLDQIQFQMKEDTTEVNLRLQPETLGTIQIQISAKEGVMTAHFTATTEEVKAILETQMEILQQNLENQDIKVEAIEVSVQPEMYENEFSQNQNEQNSNESSSRRKRNFVIDDLLTDVSNLNDDEKILAEMMIANGNTVDYQA